MEGVQRLSPAAESQCQGFSIKSFVRIVVVAGFKAVGMSLARLIRTVAL